MDPLITAYLSWLEHNKGRAPRTIEKYGPFLEQLDWFLDARGRTLLTATLKDLEDWAGPDAHRRGLRPITRGPMVSCVRGFYGWLVQQGHLQENPTLYLPTPKIGTPLPTPLSLKNAEKLLMQPDISTFIGLRDAAILSVLMGCGLRVTGLTGLNESSLQWVNYEGQEWLVIRTLEKGRKERLVPAPHDTRLLLRAYLGHEELQRIDRTLPDGDKVLFVSTRAGIPAHEYYGEARRISVNGINEMILRHGEKAGIPRKQLHAHAARHLYGTELAESGADVLHIQALMGHVDAKTTQVYTRLAMRTLTEKVASGNPLGKIRTPVSDLVKRLEEAQGHRKAAARRS